MFYYIYYFKCASFISFKEFRNNILKVYPNKFSQISSLDFNSKYTKNQIFNFKITWNLAIKN